MATFKHIVMKKYLFFILLFSYLSVSAQLKKNAPLPIIDLTSQVNFGHKTLPKRNVDIIVVHSTYFHGVDSFSISGVLKQFKENNVCSHYIIGRGGQIYSTVKENNIAYHAGVSELPGTKRTNINSTSIGIEIINSPTVPPTDAQYESLVNLVEEIKKHHPIKYIVRHSDIAPGRKTDPWMFQWEVFKNFVK